MTTLEAIRAAEAEGARVYLGDDGAPRLRGECSAQVKAALRAVRDDVPRVLAGLERAAHLGVAVRRLSAQVGQRTVPPAMLARWHAAAAGYAATGTGLDAVRAAEAAVVAALGTPESAAVPE